MSLEPQPSDPPASDLKAQAPPILDLPQILRRAAVSALLGLGLLALTLVVVSRRASDVPLAEIASRAQLAPLLGASALMSVAFVFMGRRWRALLPAGAPVNPLGLSAMLCAGLLLNYALPGPVGELGAAWFAHRRYRVGLAEALAAGVAARVVGLISASLLSALLWASFSLPVPAPYRPFVAWSAGLLGLGGVVLAVMAAMPQLWQRVSGRVLGSISRPPALVTAAARLQGGIVALTDALAEVVKRGPRAYLAATLWALCGHGAVMAGVVLAAWSFGGTPDLVGIAFTYAMTTAGAVLLFAFPGSQIGWDAMFIALLVTTAGLPLGDAVAVAAVVRVQQMGLLGVGAAALAWLMSTTGAQPAKRDSTVST